METLLVNIEGKNAATFITKVLQEFSAVMNVKKVSKKERALIESESGGIKFNAELLKDIEDYESGKMKTLKYNEAAVKKLLK